MPQSTTTPEPTMQLEIHNGLLTQFPNGILQFEKKPEISESTPEGTKALYDGIVQIQKDEKTPILINLIGLKDLKMECKLFLMNKLPDHATAVAFIIDNSPLMRYNFNMSNYLRIKTIPMSHFHDKDEALEWLYSYLSSAK